jgi:hypothetical protein
MLVVVASTLLKPLLLQLLQRFYLLPTFVPNNFDLLV